MRQLVTLRVILPTDFAELEATTGNLGNPPIALLLLHQQVVTKADR
jgi:hypothetical protein